MRRVLHSHRRHATFPGMRGSAFHLGAEGASHATSGSLIRCQAKLTVFVSRLCAAGILRSKIFIFLMLILLFSDFVVARDLFVVLRNVSDAAVIGGQGPL